MLDLVSFLLILLPLHPSQTEQGGVEVRSVQTQEPIQGQLVELSSTELSVQTGGSVQSLPTTDLLTIRFPQASESRVGQSPLIVLLHDGSRLAPKSITTAGQNVRLELAAGSFVDLSPLAIQSVQLQSLTEAQQTQWDAIIRSRIDGDTLVLIRSPESLDKIEGSIGEIGAESISFTFSGQELNAPRAKLAGLRFFSPPTQAKSIHAVITDTGGNVWNAADLSFANGSDHLEMVLAGGGQVDLPLERIALLDFSIGSLIYVAELTPTGQGRHKTNEPSLAIGSSDDLFGPQPVLLPKTSGPSLRFYGGGTVSYRVPPDYSRLFGTVYLAPSGNRFTACTVRVSLENDTVWEQKLESLSQRIDLSIPVQAEKRVRCEVTPVSELPIGDVVVWQELRLSK